jgi:hypothetical protein
MGTRADFYVGKGKDAEWLGSIAWDGNEVDDEILNATTPEEFCNAVKTFLDGRDDATYPTDGWPWPWNDSGTTDCSYWHFEGKTYEASGYPHEYYVLRSEEHPDEDENENAYNVWLEKHERIEFPDMKHLQKVTLGKRSGIMVLG